jgi:hypothetical protein
MSLYALRQQITDVIEGVVPGSPQSKGLPTGIAALDSLLPANGIPRGRLTELLGTQGSGRTSVLRRVVQAVVNDGLWVAFIDAGRTLAPGDWAHIGRENTLWIVRPPSGDVNRGAWCADVLLRSGAFALVVLDGAAVLTRSIAVRLSRLARDSNSAFIVTGDDRSATMLGGPLRLRVRAHLPAHVPAHVSAHVSAHVPAHVPAQPMRLRQESDPPSITRRPRYRKTKRFSISVEKGGSPRLVEVSCAIEVESRLCTHPEVPDRRGVARRTRGKWGTGVG